MEVVDRPDLDRFEVEVDGEIGVAAYRLRGDTITFTHTEVPEPLRGRGVGKALADAALRSARDRELKVVALCPFIAAYLRSHPEFRSLAAAPDDAAPDDAA